MNKAQLSEAYAEVVRRAVLNANADHHLDLANAAMNAVEAAGETLSALLALGFKVTG